MSDKDMLKMPSGHYSKRCWRLDLIPLPALVSLANRFQLGLDHYGDKAWNAQDSKPFPEDKEWLLQRLAHVIQHCYIAIEKITGKRPDDGDDDAGAIMWGGAFLACYDERMRCNRYTERYTEKGQSKGNKRDSPPERENPDLSPDARCVLRGVWPVVLEDHVVSGEYNSEDRDIWRDGKGPHEELFNYGYASRTIIFGVDKRIIRYELTGKGLTMKRSLDGPDILASDVDLGYIP